MQGHAKPDKARSSKRPGRSSKRRPDPPFSTQIVFNSFVLHNQSKNSEYFKSMILLALATTPADLDAYQTAELKWRENREAGLKRNTGWLSVAGLFWLKEGENTVGSEGEVKLPDYTPKAYGTLVRNGKVVTLKVPGAADRILKTDGEGTPDQVTVQEAIFTIIERGTRVGVRLYDPKSKFQQEFKGLNWFPVDAKYRIEAKFVPHKTVRTLKIANVIGDINDVPNPGYVEFKFEGKTCRMEAQQEGDVLFFNFVDKTAGKETYTPGRFLYSELPKDGKVIIDFNRAYNPPCAFTDYATCPRPPKENFLPVAIRAGEKDQPAHKD